MTPPNKYRTYQTAPGEPSDIRFLARADGYEIALIVPASPSTAQPGAEPFVRLRFLHAEVDVVLTLADFAALSTDVRRLWDYLRQEQARRSHRDQ